LEELVNPPKLPWTFTKLADDIGVRQYDDVTDEIPNEMEYERGVDEETMRPFKRIRGKATVPECPPASGTASNSSKGAKPGPMNVGLGSAENIPEDFQDEYAQAFWTQDTAAVEVGINMPDSRRGWKHLSDNFESFLTSQLRRRAVEVSERSLNPEETENE
jgi:hypothetical protein